MHKLTHPDTCEHACTYQSHSCTLAESIHTCTQKQKKKWYNLCPGQIPCLEAIKQLLYLRASLHNSLKAVVIQDNFFLTLFLPLNFTSYRTLWTCGGCKCHFSSLPYYCYCHNMTMDYWNEKHHWNKFSFKFLLGWKYTFYWSSS